jgi:hypothetical protein
MNDEEVPKEVKNFINYVVPEMYRPTTQNCIEMVKKILKDKDGLSYSLKKELKIMIEKYSPQELTYKEFCDKIVKDKNAHRDLRHFFSNLPSKYKQKVNERCRLLVDDEYLLPVNLLEHEFFSFFHVKQ